MIQKKGNTKIQYKPISVVCSTKKINPTFKEHIIKTSGLDKIEVLMYENNNEFSLTEIYNRGLKDSKYDIVVFMHDDVIMNTQDWGYAISDHFTRNMGYGIIGVAGTNKLSSGMWWEDKTHMHGIVNHSNGKNVWTSNYSPSQGIYLKRMVVLDGVFFVAHKKRIKSNFNESFKGFHFYDLSFTLDNFLNNVKIGVITNVRITHMSIGETNDKWEENKELFESLYKDKFPITI